MVCEVHGLLAGRAERGIRLRRRGLLEGHARGSGARGDRGAGPASVADAPKSYIPPHGMLQTLRICAEDDMTPAELLSILHATAARAPRQSKVKTLSRSNVSQGFITI